MWPRTAGDFKSSQPWEAIHQNTQAECITLDSAGNPAKKINKTTNQQKQRQNSQNNNKKTLRHIQVRKILSEIPQKVK